MQSNHHIGGCDSPRSGHGEPTGRGPAAGDTDALVELLGDEYAQEILTALSTEPLAAATLADRLDMSRATVYRRLNRLRDHGLVAADTAISPDGNNYAVFEAVVRRITVDLSGGAPTISVERRENRNDRAPLKTAASAD